MGRANSPHEKRHMRSQRKQPDMRTREASGDAAWRSWLVSHSDGGIFHEAPLAS